MNRILMATGALFALLLIYLIPKETVVNNISSSTYLNNLTKASVYLLDDNNMLAKTTVVIDSTNLLDQANELLEVLIHDGKKESSIPNGFRSFLPSDTLINGIVYDNKLLTVDFNKNILNIDKDLEMSMIESIVYTLTDLEEVKSVSLTVDGENLNRLPNSNIYIPNILSRTFGINKNYDITNLDNINGITVYYLNEYNDNYYYVPVTKYVNDDRDKIKIIIEDLTSSNMYKTDLISFINSNTKLLEANLEEDKLELIFNSYILDDFDKRNILEEVIETITLSVKDNYDVDEVVFYVEDDEICKSVIKSIE